MARSSAWHPKGTAAGLNGKDLFSHNCSACDWPDSLGNGPLSSNLARRPGNLVAGPFPWTPQGDDLGLRVARTIKFGLPGIDMPGHETLTDAEILALGLRSEFPPELLKRVNRWDG